MQRAGGWVKSEHGTRPAFDVLVNMPRAAAAVTGRWSSAACAAYAAKHAAAERSGVCVTRALWGPAHLCCAGWPGGAVSLSW